MVTPQANFSPAGILPRLRRFRVTGIFDVGMYEYDRGVALVHMEDAARLFKLDNAITGIRLKLQDLFKAPQVSRQLADGVRGMMLDIYSGGSDLPIQERGPVYLCHGVCELGSKELSEELAGIKQFMDENPAEVGLTGHTAIIAADW